MGGKYLNGLERKCSRIAITIFLVCSVIFFTSPGWFFPVEAACDPPSGGTSGGGGATQPSCSCKTYTDPPPGTECTYSSGHPAGGTGTFTSCFCDTVGEAKACSGCGGGGGGNTQPTCSITTGKASYNDGEYIYYQVNAGDNGEVFGGTTGNPQLYYPVISGTGCNSNVGFCPSTNLCSNGQSEPECQNVCTGTHATAVNPSGGARTCTISASFSNIGADGSTPQVGTCQTSVTVNPPAGGPNLLLS